MSKRYQAEEWIGEIDAQEKRIMWQALTDLLGEHVAIQRQNQDAMAARDEKVQTLLDRCVKYLDELEAERAKWTPVPMPTLGLDDDEPPTPPVPPAPPAPGN